MIDQIKEALRAAGLNPTDFMVVCYGPESFKILHFSSDYTIDGHGESAIGAAAHAFASRLDPEQDVARRAETHFRAFAKNQGATDEEIDAEAAKMFGAKP